MDGAWRDRRRERMWELVVLPAGYVEHLTTAAAQPEGGT